MTDFVEVYTRSAALYAEMLSDFSFEAEMDRQILEDFLKDVARANAPAKLLDLGCGAGRAVPLVIDAEISYVGCDPSVGMLQQAQATYPNQSFLIGLAQDLPLEKASFSAVLGWYSLIHCSPEELQKAFIEIHRVLAPAGNFLCAFQVGIGERVIENAYQTGESMIAWLYEPVEVAACLESLGFSEVSWSRRLPREAESYPQGFVVAKK